MRKTLILASAAICGLSFFSVAAKAAGTQGVVGVFEKLDDHYKSVGLMTVQYPSFGACLRGYANLADHIDFGGGGASCQDTATGQTRDIIDTQTYTPIAADQGTPRVSITHKFRFAP